MPNNGNGCQSANRSREEDQRLTFGQNAGADLDQTETDSSATMTTQSLINPS